MEYLTTAYNRKHYNVHALESDKDTPVIGKFCYDKIRLLLTLYRSTAYNNCCKLQTKYTIPHFFNAYCSWVTDLAVVLQFRVGQQHIFQYIISMQPFKTK